MTGGMREMLRNKRLWAAVVVVALILAAALWPEAIEVDVAPVERGDLEVTIDEEGETRVREPFMISAPVAGRLQRIVLEPGDRIERDRSVLARLAPADPSLLDPRTRAELTAASQAARAALGQARAERGRAAATLERASDTLRRQQELEAGGLVSRDELEAARVAHRTAEEALRAAEFSVARAEHDLRMAQARIQQPSGGGGLLEIRAPIDGVVLRRFRESEGIVPAGERLLEVGDPARLEVIADLLSTEAVQVSAGDPVRIEQWGGGRPLAGRVRRVEPSGFMKVSALGVEEQRVNVLIDFVNGRNATGELGDGYRVEVRIIVWREDGVLAVPMGALFRRGAEWAVFAVRDGQAQLRTVEIGQRNSTAAQVLDGLSPGDTVVLHPPDALTDGGGVRVRGV
jgi:HlyD family secretion protein